MKTRVQKWARYRDQIAKTPENRFPKKNTEGASSLPMHAAERMARSTEAIVGSDGKERKMTPYLTHLKREKTMLAIKVGLFVLAIVLLILLFVYWVR